jgi:hypothetical protein
MFMRPKKLLGIALVAFAGASLAYLAVGALRGGGDDPAAGAEGHAEPDGVTVYYFRGALRCPTCLKIEAYTKETVEREFADALADGRMHLRVVDHESEPNEHFAERYDLVTKSVVVSEWRGGREVRWRNLPRIWDLVGDRDAFVAYVRGEVARFVEGE